MLKYFRCPKILYIKDVTLQLLLRVDSISTNQKNNKNGNKNQIAAWRT